MDVPASRVGPFLNSSPPSARVFGADETLPLPTTHAAQFVALTHLGAATVSLFVPDPAQLLTVVRLRAISTTSRPGFPRHMPSRNGPANKALAGDVLRTAGIPPTSCFCFT
jgi:hypothetical protein